MKDQDTVTSQTMFEKFEELVSHSEELGNRKSEAVAMFRYMCGTPGFVEHTLTCPAKDINEVRIGCSHMVPKAIFMSIVDMVIDRDFPKITFIDKSDRMKFLSDITDIFIEGLAELLFE